MFSKTSRYRKLPDIVTIDSKGRALRSKTLRLLPEVTGDFFHTVEEMDRLDYLAHKYYDQPRKWWRICDANHEFLSPQALLGKDPVLTIRFSLTFDDNDKQPPWSDLLKKLSEISGIEDVKVLEEIRLIPETFYKITSQSLGYLETKGVPHDILEYLEDIKGKEIIGQKKFIGVLRAKLSDEQVLEFSSLIFRSAEVIYNGQKLRIYIEQFDYYLQVTYNQMIISSINLKNIIMDDTRFKVGRPESIGRVGKKIIIPQNIIG